MSNFKKVLVLFLVLVSVLVSVSNISMAETTYTDDLCINKENASASSSQSGRTSDRAFDDNYDGDYTLTGWQSLHTAVIDHWISYDFGEGNEKKITKFTVSVGKNTAYGISDFIYQGSNDNVNWVDIQKYDDFVFEKALTPTEFIISNENYYRYYRLYITDIKNGKMAIINEIEMMENYVTPETTPPLLSITNDGEEIGLSWNSIDNAEYTIKRSATVGGPYNEIATTSNTYFVDSKVEKNKDYYYVVSAKIEGIEGQNSNEVHGYILEEEPEISNAVLRIWLNDSKEVVYDINTLEVEQFLDWLEDASNGNGKPYYSFNLPESSGAFTKEKSYLMYEKIVYFEVAEY